MSGSKTWSESNIMICRCEEISKDEILKAIDEGFTTVSEIRKRTRSGMGFCQGKSCSKIITQILVEKGFDEAKLEPARVRPPVRPIPVEVFIKGADEL